MEAIHIIQNIDELPKLAEQLLSFAQKHKIFVFKGDLGAGKTTFIKAITKHLGCEEEITSPTYSIVNEYMLGTDTIFHFDLYRMKSYEEILDIGFWDYFIEKPYIFIEWADLVVDELEKYVFINVETLATEKRTFTFSFVG